MVSVSTPNMWYNNIVWYLLWLWNAFKWLFIFAFIVGAVVAGVFFDSLGLGKPKNPVIGTSEVTYVRPPPTPAPTPSPTPSPIPTFPPINNFIMFVDPDSTLLKYNDQNNSIGWTIDLGSPINHYTLLKDNTRILAGTNDGAKFIDIKESTYQGKILLTLDQGVNVISTALLNSLGFTGTLDGTVSSWNMETGERLQNKTISALPITDIKGMGLDKIVVLADKVYLLDSVNLNTIMEYPTNPTFIGVLNDSEFAVATNSNIDKYNSEGLVSSYKNEIPFAGKIIGFSANNDDVAALYEIGTMNIVYMGSTSPVSKLKISTNISEIDGIDYAHGGIVGGGFIWNSSNGSVKETTGNLVKLPKFFN